MSVTSVVPSSAFDYSHVYVPGNASTLSWNIVVLVFVFNENNGPKGYVNLANITLIFNAKISVEFYNVTFESPLNATSFFSMANSSSSNLTWSSFSSLNNSNADNLTALNNVTAFEQITVTVKNETRLPDEYFFVSEVVEFVSWGSSLIRTLKSNTAVSADESRTRFTSSIPARTVCSASNITSHAAFYKQVPRWIRSVTPSSSCKILNITGNINSNCEISGADALALVKYLTPKVWPLCGTLVHRTVWNGCGLNMLLLTNAPHASSSYRQLGLGDTVMRTQPEVLESMKTLDISQIALGQQHSLVIASVPAKDAFGPMLRKGVLYAWGDSFVGQLGHGDYTPRTTPVPIRGCLQNDIKWQLRIRFL